MQLKGLSGTGRDTQPLLFQPGKPGKHSLGSVLVTRQFHGRNCAMGRVGRASGGGKKWGRLPQCQLPAPSPPHPRPPHPPQGTARRGGAVRTTELRWPRPRFAVGAAPSLGQRPPPRASWDSATGWSASGNCRPIRRWGTRLAASIAAGNSGLALSVRAPGLPAAPRPRPRQPGCPFEW